jgi:hypothetical protein
MKLRVPDLTHGLAYFFDQFVAGFQLLERHLFRPGVGRDLVFQFEDVITLQAKRDAAERAGVAGIALLEGGRHDAQIVRLIEAEHDDKLLRSVLVGQLLYLFLLRKTCGASGGSHETGRRFVDDFTTGSFDAVAYGLAGHIVAFAEDSDFFCIQHHLGSF